MPMKAQTEGLASYYANKFHGRRTSSGSTYDKNAYTCAHRTYPFGTLLKVTNLRNNKSTIVKVNDRGPFAHKRIIDLSYAAARQAVMERRLGEAGKRLAEPNNILGVEYIKAIYDLHLDMEPLAIRREGSEHDGEGAPGKRSASELRGFLKRGGSIRGEVPAKALSVYENERRLGRELRDRSVLETAILSRLRLFDEAYFGSLPDALEGLGTRIWQAVRREASYDGILAASRTKRYPLARIRRLCLCACLGVHSGMAEGTPPYARVLAANARGREILRERGAKAALPFVTKPAAVRELGREAERLFTLGADAHDFYALAYTSLEERRPGADWRTGPRILES